ncbi:High-affinity zinc uptake system binding-protein ZnuA [Vagococcus luciliae]|uniref:High-affinity zinc uptake system binding-protein ZnuA n=2 Tax=Vagococcus luciliae TaxID=2920380 RepID=A0ABY5P0C4_9ENTE|nr:metal ABC transporter substrate-binding protein [Vagococcus luciliae]UUV99083.1 High-affinity zinc uptake system binding-protein ZnuA [Vagococcus luciliae]
MKRITKIILGLALIGVLAACGKESKEEQKEADTLHIVTSFYPMYDFAKKITGDEADVTVLTEAGVEPHDYEPSAKDLAKIQNADVFIYNSNEMETWVRDVLASIDTKKVKVIEASQGIDLMEATEEEHEGEDSHNHELDPHVWLDPVLAKKEVETITKGLVEVDTPNKDVYERQSKDFIKELDKLNDAYVEATKDATQKTFVTQHTAFSYLAKQYGLTQVAISGISPDQEPTPKELKNIEDLVKKDDIKVIYTESSASSKVAETITSATGATLSELNPLESLTKKEMDGGEDYLSVMYTNLDHLKLTIK